MSANATSRIQRVQEKGWRRGLGNLWQGEYSAWFKSSRWWKHLILWFSVINLMMVFMVIASTEAAKEGEQGPPVLFMYGLFGGMFAAFGVMIIMQRVLISEKRAGTAAWVLSKPVTRTAFVVSRLGVNTIAILLTAVLAPGVIFYLTLGGFSDMGWLPPIGYLVGLLMLALHTCFWIALVLMMGTLTDSSSAVIAVPMVLYFGLWFGSGMIPGLIYLSPLMLTFSPDPEKISALSASFMLGEPVFSWLPLISTVAFTVLFIAIAIQRFNRQEF